MSSGIRWMCDISLPIVKVHINQILFRWIKNMRIVWNKRETELHDIMIKGPITWAGLARLAELARFAEISASLLKPGLRGINLIFASKTRNEKHVLTWRKYSLRTGWRKAWDYEEKARWQNPLLLIAALDLKVVSQFGNNHVILDCAKRSHYLHCLNYHHRIKLQQKWINCHSLRKTCLGNISYLKALLAFNMSIIAVFISNK